MNSIHIFIICFLINFSKTNIPSISNKQASQWLNIPHRWHGQYQFTNDIHRSYKQLELINENGFRRFHTRTIESISMEVFYELSQFYPDVI